jgi:hypothetical protein
MDYKKLGLTALDVVVGIGSAVAGGYGGPEAAKGVQMAGSAIKTGVNDFTGDGGRADKLDREDFQARSRAIEQRNKTPETEESSDLAFSRQELIRQGWSAEKADRILAGPGEGTTVAGLFGEPGGDAPKEGGRRNRGRTVAGAEGRRVREDEGQTTKGKRGDTVEATEGNGTFAALGKVLSGVLSNKG